MRRRARPRQGAPAPPTQALRAVQIAGQIRAVRNIPDLSPLAALLLLSSSGRLSKSDKVRGPGAGTTDLRWSASASATSTLAPNGRHFFVRVCSPEGSRWSLNLLPRAASVRRCVLIRAPSSLSPALRALLLLCLHWTGSASLRGGYPGASCASRHTVAVENRSRRRGRPRGRRCCPSGQLDGSQEEQRRRRRTR